MANPIQKVSREPLTALNQYHRNARTGDVAAIAESLSTLGQFKPVVANVGTHTGRPGEVLAGNHTVQAARSLDWTEVEVAWVDVDDETAAKIVLADNRTSDLSSYDNDALASLLGSLPDLSGTGFTDSDYTRLLPPVQADEDEWKDLKLPSFVVSYQLVFDDEAQQAVWHEYLRWLKANVEGTSLGERLVSHLRATVIPEAAE